jgi:hypothetical protein
LLQPDSRRKSRRPGADDHDVELHRFAARKILHAHAFASAVLAAPASTACSSMKYAH